MGSAENAGRLLTWLCLLIILTSCGLIGLNRPATVVKTNDLPASGLLINCIKPQESAKLDQTQEQYQKNPLTGLDLLSYMMNAEDSFNECNARLDDLRAWRRDAAQYQSNPK